MEVIRLRGRNISESQGHSEDEGTVNSRRTRQEDLQKYVRKI